MCFLRKNLNAGEDEEINKNSPTVIREMPKKKIMYTNNLIVSQSQESDFLCYS